MTNLGHGQLWWADFPDEKVRPVVILTRERVAGRLRRLLVAPVTTVVRAIPTEVPVGAEEGVRDGSVANLDNTQLLEVGRLLQRAGTVRADRWPEFCTAMAKVMACPRR